ncbi:MAG: MAPEG family protein [Litorilituus sp.]|jgi:hypothetical protein|nr:MAPEG family protein [Litorilituus sp.]
MSLPITALYASLLALIFLFLSFRVIGFRRRLKVGVGDGGEKALIKAIRVHGNFSEYVPLTLILLGCYELSGADDLLVHLFGATLLLGRLLHAVGLTKSAGVSNPRFIGTLLTFITLLLLATVNVLVFFTA